MGHETVHWEGFKKIPPQIGPQADEEVNSEKTGWSMNISPTGGRYGGGGIAGGGYLRLPLPEHSLKVYCDQAHYGSVSGGGAEAGVKGGQAVVVARQTRFEGDVDGGSGSRTDGGGGGYGRDGYGDKDRLSWWNNIVAQVNLGAEPNPLLVSAPGLETHHPIMSAFGEPGGRLWR